MSTDSVKSESLENDNRNQEWLDIWQRKYGREQVGRDLHVLDGYDGMTSDEWSRLCQFAISKMEIKATDDVLEVGCGCGAFLNELECYGSISGVEE